jgi:hypothetical protein
VYVNGSSSEAVADVAEADAAARDAIEGMAAFEDDAAAEAVVEVEAGRRARGVGGSVETAGVAADKDDANDEDDEEAVEGNE